MGRNCRRAGWQPEHAPPPHLSPHTILSSASAFPLRSCSAVLPSILPAGREGSWAAAQGCKGRLSLCTPPPRVTAPAKKACFGQACKYAKVPAEYCHQPFSSEVKEKDKWLYENSQIKQQLHRPAASCKSCISCSDIPTSYPGPP